MYSPDGTHHFSGVSTHNMPGPEEHPLRRRPVCGRYGKDTIEKMLGKVYYGFTAGWGFQTKND